MRSLSTFYRFYLLTVILTPILSPEPLSRVDPILIKGSC